jgi:hypothetical protein
MAEQESRTQSVQLRAGAPGETPTKLVTISGPLPDLHDNPEKVRQLLDLLELPKGTQVEIVTQASSVIVR